MLDIKDPMTWYFLGNAYFSNFITNFKRFNELENAIKAYNEAVSMSLLRKSILSISTQICIQIEGMFKAIWRIIKQQTTIFHYQMISKITPFA